MRTLALAATAAALVLTGCDGGQAQRTRPTTSPTPPVATETVTGVAPACALAPGEDCELPAELKTR